ncbi:DUF3159 domain-containing protein [Cryobacterium sp. CG_9.6]|uniref:DUF3159 domain-containing protein n=1 Tax=Cryobacterium sp. CG_9.6 TaxID=2760710 RepID=UPI00247413DC|nr:DUF3159 domain-containing protein [Cryobacterium sp. CG_9.6]MDH6237339.1 hypothetical protein [Cryobacterium sp. CG_9.6]
MTHHPDPTDPADQPDSDPARAAAGDASSDQPTVSGVVAEGMAAAARRAGFSSAAEGESINGQALLAAMGGIRGLFEAILPGLVFLVTYTLTIDPEADAAAEPIVALLPALIAPLVLGLIFVVLRVATKQTTTPAVGGLVGTALSVALALFSGKASDFFLVGLYTNAGYGAALLISVLVGWPLVGLAVGFLMGDGIAWRSDPSKRRVLTILTLCWTGLFLARLAVQLPLYLADNVELLATTKLLMGLPLYAPLLIVSWLMVRSIYRKPAPTA